MTRCTFLRNTASGQIGAYGAQNYTVTEMSDCVFAGNTAFQNVGTALIHRYCTVFMTNCTFINSRSTQCTFALGDNVIGRMSNGRFKNNTSTKKCKYPEGCPNKQDFRQFSKLSPMTSMKKSEKYKFDPLH